MKTLIPVLLVCLFATSLPAQQAPDTNFNVAVANQPQVPAAGRAQGVAMKFGQGRVVVLGEASELSAQRAGPQGRAMGMNFPGCDNRQFGLNIIHWLSGLTA